MIRFILFFGCTFFVTSMIHAMVPGDLPIEDALRSFSMKTPLPEPGQQLMTEEEMLRARIHVATNSLFDVPADFNKILSLLAPIFNEDKNLVVEIRDYKGEAHYAYAEALWALDRKQEAASWFVKAASYRNNEALTHIGAISQKAIKLFDQEKQEEAFKQYVSDLRKYLLRE